MLYGYFDESGTHGNAQHTLISGFVGRAEDWSAVVPAWRAILARDGISTFHYVHCRHRQKAYWKWSIAKSEKHLNDLSEVIATSDLRGVAASFSGIWKDAIKPNRDWGKRFPSSYHFCMEMCAEQLKIFSDNYWGSEPIALIFSAHQQFSRRVYEVWHTMKFNGQWGHLVSFTYALPSDFAELQAADLIASDSYQFMRLGLEDSWQKLPLLSRLVPKEEATGRTLYGGHYNTSTFAELMSRTRGPYLRRAPGY